MKIDADLNFIKEALLIFSKSQGLSSEHMDDFTSDFAIDWNDEFSESLSKLNEQVGVFRRALERNDKVVQVAALVVARGISLRLLNQFEGIFEDIEKIAWSEEYDWPVIPGDYQIPSDYSDLVKDGLK